MSNESQLIEDAGDGNESALRTQGPRRRSRHLRCPSKGLPVVADGDQFMLAWGKDAYTAAEDVLKTVTHRK